MSIGMRKTQRWRVETTDEMPGDIKPTLTPLASWFSLDIAAQLDDSEDEEENERDAANTSQAGSVLPSRLPAVWSIHDNRPSSTQLRDQGSLAHHERSSSPAAGDIEEVR